MAVQTYALNAFRIGKYKGTILKVASAREVLAKQGRVVAFPQNRVKLVVFFRFIVRVLHIRAPWIVGFWFVLQLDRVNACLDGVVLHAY